MLAPSLYGRLQGVRTRVIGRDAHIRMPHTGRPCVLLVDHDFPEVDRDAGSRAIASFAGLLGQAGLDVVFWAASTDPSDAGREYLREQGIHALSRQQTGPLGRWLVQVSPRFRASVLSRPLVAAMYMPVVRRHIPGPCIYYGHDVHHRRLRAMRKIAAAGLSDRWEMTLMTMVEHRLWRKADHVLYPSKEEADVVNSYRDAKGMLANGEMFPLWTLPSGVAMPIIDPRRRKSLLFVGSYAHAPNIDGLNWFLRDVAPYLKVPPGQCKLTIVGSGMQDYVPPEGTTMDIDIRGRVDDAALVRCYSQSRAVVAPLRFGGGVKGKVLEAIGHGVPCVMTTPAAQGLAGIESLLPVVDDPAAYAKALARLLSDDEAWITAAKAAYQFLEEKYDSRHFIERLKTLLAA